MSEETPGQAARPDLDPVEGDDRRRLVLVRHGQTAWNHLERAQGHTDVALDETGHAQIVAAAPALAAMKPTRLWTSDLTRARQSMQYVEEETGLLADVDPRLREYDVGVRAGLTKSEFAERYPEEYAAYLVGDPAPLVRGEESPAQVRERMGAALRDCLAALPPGEAGIVMTHGSSLKVGLAGLLGWPSEVRHGLAGLENAAWAVVADHLPRHRHLRHGSGLQLLAWNRRAPGNQRRR